MYGMYRPLSHLQAERRATAYAAVRPLVEKCLKELALAGVTAVTFGSFARGVESFGERSDIDLLILDKGLLSEREISRMAADAISPTPIDLVFSSDLTEQKVAHMLALSTQK